MISDPLLAAVLSGAAWMPSSCLALVWWRHERRRRRRVAVAMHELRRPLQALLLSEALDAGDGPRLGPIDLAIAALGQLEAATGSSAARPSQPAVPDCSWAQLLTDAADRWQQAAWLCGRAITVAAGAIASGDAADAGAARGDDPRERAPAPGDVLCLAGALDNLVLNALLHGTGDIHLGLRRKDGRLELLVTDGHRRPDAEPFGAAVTPGARARPGRRTGPDGRGTLNATPAATKRHGHGLRVVAEAAAALGGSFSLDRDRDGRGSAAVLALPDYRFVS